MINYAAQSVAQSVNATNKLDKIYPSKNTQYIVRIHTVLMYCSLGTVEMHQVLFMCAHMKISAFLTVTFNTLLSFF